MEARNTDVHRISLPAPFGLGVLPPLQTNLKRGVRNTIIIRLFIDSVLYPDEMKIYPERRITLFSHYMYWVAEVKMYKH